MQIPDYPQKLAAATKDSVKHQYTANEMLHRLQLMWYEVDFASKIRD